MQRFTPAMRDLLWPPMWEARAQAEGWTLRVAGGCVEVDFYPTSSMSADPIYYGLIQWLVLNAFVLGDPMYRTAWEFEYDSNAMIYDDRRIPGDLMHMALDENDEVVWVDDENPDRVWLR